MRKKHGKPSFRVRKISVRVRKISVRVLYVCIMGRTKEIVRENN
jgi:hypothetical protein